MTSPISGVTAATAAQTAATQKTTASSAGTLDPQAFLQLLVAQLKYQDPTNPTDTSTFMNQTAMLSQVQTMNSMSSTLSALADAQQAQSATSLIGKQVGYTDDAGLPKTGVVTSASLSATGATVLVGGVTVPLGNVTTVSDPS